MNKQLVTFIPILIVLTLAACESPKSQIVEGNPSYLSSYLQHGDYTINPATILPLIDRGNLDVFTPVIVTPDSQIQPLPSGSISWTESDYMKIADALSQFVWEEPLDLGKWSVFYLAFNKECHDDSLGFDSMELTYYKKIPVDRQEVYSSRHLEIYPLDKQVSWGGETNFSIADNWYGLNMTEFTINADDALRLAEEQGGQEARSKVKNNCRILVRTPNHNEDNRWDVSYYLDANFELLVDPYSGTYEIPTPSQ